MRNKDYLFTKQHAKRHAVFFIYYGIYGKFVLLKRLFVNLVLFYP